MPSLNVVLLIGNLTRDPELRYIPSGTAVCEFGMAMNKKYRTGDGEDREEVCFVDVTCWGKTAELVSEYLSKGSLCHVTGELKLDRWETTDGDKRSKLTVTANRVLFLGKPGGGGSQAGPGDGPIDDDIPF